jgi:hypothetical protein
VSRRGVPAGLSHVSALVLVLAGVLGVGLISGCSSGSDDSTPAEIEAAEPAGTVFDPMTSQLDKAREAAETLPRERKEGLDQAIDGDSN